MDFAPSSYAARTLLARIQQAKGNTQEAIASYEKLLVESPSDSEGFYLIGKWSMDLKEWQKAEDNMKKAMTLGYYTTELLNNLASTEVQLGRKTDAVTYWQKSLEIDSNQPTVKQQIDTYKQ
jgi:Tfp pilus assembly protein PilF